MNSLSPLLYYLLGLSGDVVRKIRERLFEIAELQLYILFKDAVICIRNDVCSNRQAESLVLDVNSIANIRNLFKIGAKRVINLRN